MCTQVFLHRPFLTPELTGFVAICGSKFWPFKVSLYNKTIHIPLAKASPQPSPLIKINKKITCGPLGGLCQEKKMKEQGQIIQFTVISLPIIIYNPLNIFFILCFPCPALCPALVNVTKKLGGKSMSTVFLTWLWF